jgi:hypothetical protein
MQTQPHVPEVHKLHKTGQFLLEENVEYKIVNRFKFIELLSIKGIIVPDKIQEDLGLIKQYALSQGLTVEEVEMLSDKCARQIFNENGLGKLLLTNLRKIVDSPIAADGKVKKGFLNHLAAYGVQIPGITGNFDNKKNVRNLVTNAGFAGVASRINGSGSEAAFTYIEVGIGTTAAAAGNTALESAITDSGLARANSTASRVTTTQTNDTAQLVNSFTVTGTKAVTESGVFNASSAGVMLCRQVFSAINVQNGDSLQITWKIKAA